MRDCIPHIARKTALDHDIQFLKRLGINANAERLNQLYIEKVHKAWENIWHPHMCLKFDEAELGEWIDE